jgi:uncharacterized membrane protein YqaE (UPF0057 family)
MLMIILCFLLPPLVAFWFGGIFSCFIILFVCLGYIPGVIHAVWLLMNDRVRFAKNEIEA